jgi:hypothetical protein
MVYEVDHRTGSVKREGLRFSSGDREMAERSARRFCDEGALRGLEVEVWVVESPSWVVVYECRARRL